MDCSLDSPDGSSITESRGLGNPVVVQVDSLRSSS